MRRRSGVRRPAALTAEQEETLEGLLRNESDVAFRRRVWSVLRYLDLKPGLRVLDCGTGMGFYAMVVKRLYPSCQVYSIDLDPEALSYAASHLLQEGVLLIRADAQHLPFAADGFDRVILSEVLEHLPDDAQGLREVWRVLKPGGALALTVPCRHYPYWYDPINRLTEALMGRPIRRGPFAGIWANHERLYTEQQLLRRLEEASFFVEESDRLTHYCFPGTQTIVYTVGKGLIERGLLPNGISRRTHRFRGEENTGGRLSPLNWALSIFDWFDRWNDNDKRLARKDTFVNLGVKARKA